ncbi:hypothetical protein [Streptomyces daliensis]|uniref:Uncharacterized protein n=1 Tax=Streptomyces daliensis TaxID=299421 RepID=A0A8T4IQ14_9ACTN|nr:hypothetical protein [Streptomyces daliensis]
METPDEITTLIRTDHQQPYTASPVVPAIPPQAVPVAAILPNGQRAAAYLRPDQIAALVTAQQPESPAPDQSPIDTRISGRAKGAALIALASGVGTGAATAGIGYGAGLLAQASEGLMTAALALAIATGSLTGALLFVRFFFGVRRSTQTTHITQHNVATGFFGRAGGTIHH